MNAEIKINGNSLTSIREASTEVSYSRDYVTRLAREGKIVASLIGRQWFVDLESLKNYAVQSQIESDLRKVQLSEERKNEQLFHKAKEQQTISQQELRISAQSRAVTASASVLALGLCAGVFAYAFFVNPLVFDSVIHRPGAADNSQKVASVITSENFLAETRQDSAVKFSAKTVADFESAENGILILPQMKSDDMTNVFSDEVYIKTATSGKQSAVLVDQSGTGVDREVPLVIVPVNTRSY